ncbi:MarR family transcriptional regulator [Halococcus sp. IIIV-5B]|uniref:MarR family transcriptional regulator n=1 Tax=Halococcus sp. IIIV-5B TaxID=2321230 RepID=UPI000E757BAC|nr:MarR family transcriptional regulator [Halococcus sp. IIIV-5B]RJT07580.1 MarR family transcriptional regulator [Halococcus sp. IIIV-5B]
MCDDVDQELLDLPPSAKLVFVVLEEEGPLTQKQIIKNTLLSPRTARYALTLLEEIGRVSADIHFADARQSIYETTR